MPKHQNLPTHAELHLFEKQHLADLMLLAVLCLFVMGSLGALASPELTSSVLTRVFFGKRLERQMIRQGSDHLALQTVIDGYSLKHAAPDGNPYNKAGVYLTASSVANDEFFGKTMDALIAAGGSTFVVDVKGSFVYFRSASPLAGQLDQIRPIYELPALVSQAKKRGLYVIARFIALKDPVLAQKVPDAQLRNPDTGQSVGAVWVDGSHPTVLEYNYQVIRDVALAGVDEINLDYIRFPTEYPWALRGLSGQQKTDKVEKLVKVARQAIDHHNPEVKLGISTYAILGWNYPVNLEALGQDFVRFAPLVDVISPMAYPSTFGLGGYYDPAKNRHSRNYWLVYRTMTGYQELLGPRHAYKLRPWIQGYHMSAIGMRDQMQAVYDSGACGFTVWSANNIYGVTYAGMGSVVVPEACV